MDIAFRVFSCLACIVVTVKVFRNGEHKRRRPWWSPTWLLCAGVYLIGVIWWGRTGVLLIAISDVMMLLNILGGPGDDDDDGDLIPIKEEEEEPKWTGRASPVAS